ncbi:HpcH/HpaI aldolase/citrate lyase family protein [Schumannella luteola]
MSGIAAARVLRSHLYVPADNEAMLAKAASRGADALILDLEDAVAPSRKDAAREAALAYAAAADPEGPEVWVRLNDGDLGMVDLDALAGAPGVAGVWFAKAEPGEWLERALDRARGTRVGVLLESARAIARLSDLPDLPADALVQIGEADLAADLRIAGDEQQLEVYGSLVVLECAARALAPPVAPVSVDVRDMAGYRAQSERMLARGFRGRACVHPAQVAEANAVWAISPEDRERAARVIAEFEQHEAAGVGAFRGSDGTMVDRATVRWAREVLASAAR